MKFAWIFFIFIFLNGCGSDSPSRVVNTQKENLTIVENQYYTLEPYLIDTSYDSFKWVQVCGVPVLNNQDENSLSIDFLAPESDKDQKYCFEFTGHKGNDTYVKSYDVTVVAPTVEVYIDHASLPTLQQLMHMVEEHDKDDTTKRFVSWERVKLSETAQDILNAKFFNIVNNNISTQFIDAIVNYAKNKNRVNVKLFSNTAVSITNLSPIIKALKSSANATISKINLYDDGSFEYMDLYSWKESDSKIELLDRDSILLKSYLDGESDVRPQAMSARYNWHRIYNVNYNFLRKDYLDVEPKLNDFREYLGDSLTQMQWDQFSKMPLYKQKLLLSIVGFDKAKLQSQYDSSSLPNFVFTGTTTWAGGETREFYAKQQVNVINNAINETSPYYLGRDYDLFFKGHPRGEDINDYIISSFEDITNIPASVSFELLLMTGMIPDKVAGVASSLYFTIPADNVDFIVFTSSEDITDREEALKSPLVQVMMKLNIVKEDNVLFWSDLPNCESGVCISH
ncbi:hypothetical protein [Shewanella cutis]|uniref:Sialyltransferase n=3 Tax=Shewanella TaxID=22 RepID=A0ABS9QSU5_9GAMM|nr:hypothetical protein [Shewanella sp. PS-2]MCG9962551.1 hypothetical protein [Shewanella sp. PS-2]